MCPHVSSENALIKTLFILFFFLDRDLLYYISFKMVNLKARKGGRGWLSPSEPVLLHRGTHMVAYSHL